MINFVYLCLKSYFYYIFYGLWFYVLCNVWMGICVWIAVYILNGAKRSESEESSKSKDSTNNMNKLKIDRKVIAFVQFYNPVDQKIAETNAKAENMTIGDNIVSVYPVTSTMAQKKRAGYGRDGSQESDKGGINHSTSRFMDDVLKSSRWGRRTVYGFVCLCMCVCMCVVCVF